MQHSIKILNFNKILDDVKTNFIFDLSQDYTKQFLKIETTYEKVFALQQFTEMLYEDQNKFGVPDFLSLHSFEKIKQKINHEQSLDINDFIQIANLYNNIQRLQLFYQKHDTELTQKQKVKELLEPFIENGSIVKEIYKIIDTKGNILDQASQILFHLRQDKKQLEQSIRSTLQQLMQSQKTKLAEQLFTLRNNRYVLPIKAEFKNTFPGILHDQSASGTTVYIEPQTLVNINNRLQQIEIEEKQEIERLLTELSHKVFDLQNEMKQNLWAMARYDIYNAKAQYSFKHELSKITISSQQEIELYKAKHPLLNQSETVSNDILLGTTYQTLMITGANTGGKSVFLKTIGILVLMAQTGLFLPIDRNQDNKIGVFNNIFIDIGDEQSLEQNLSTFSGHIQNMKNILAHSNHTSLVLLDELGSGTDPIQGSALAIAMLEQLHKNQALVVGTTHFNEVKEFIVKASYAENAAMIFDVEKMMPTYKIRYGSYGASYAFDIAKALALPENIINFAKEHAASFTDQSQELLVAYEQRLKDVDELAEELSLKQKAIETQELALQTKIIKTEKEIEQQRKKILDKSEKELQDKINKVNHLLEEMKDKKTLKQNEHANIKGTLNVLKQNKQQKQNTTLQNEQINFKENDIVYVQTLQSNGTILKKQGNKWLVKVGNLSMTLGKKDLLFVKHGKQQKQDVRNVKKTMQAVPAKLDLRGFRVVEGIDTLETYLANASSSHDVVRIIHGHGTGSMRDAVQTTLRKNKHVKSFRFGGEGEGGVGATIVELK